MKKSKTQKKQLRYGLIFGLIFTLLIVGNGAIGYWDQDEAAYVGFALQFLKSGQWAIPDFMWSDLHRKPPLHFWNIALAFKTFGVSEFVTRLPAVLAVLGTLLLIRFMGKPLFGKDVALKASLIAGTSILMISLAKISVTDGTLLFFETLTVLCLLNYIKSKNLFYLLGLVAGIAGGALTKGPPVLILTYGILGILFLFKEYRLQTMLLFAISLLGLIPIYAWGHYIWKTDKAFILWMIDWYILKRGKGVFGQTGPPGYHLGIMLLSMFAFSSFFILGLKDSLWALFNKRLRNKTTLFLLAWLFSGWLVYEFVSSKLPAYAIGALPAFSVMAALQFQSNQFKRHTGTWKTIASGAQLILTLGVGIVFIYAAFNLLAGSAKLVSLATGIITICLGLFSFKEKNKTFLLLCFSAILPSIIAWWVIIPALENQRSTTKRVANYIQKTYSDETPVIFTQNFSLTSLPVYLSIAEFQYTELQGMEEWKERFERGDVLIFKRESYFQFRKQYPDIDYKDLKVKEISGWIPDRGKKIHYFVISKNL